MTRTALLLGSGEFEPWVEAAERAALTRATGDGSVAVLPTASASEGDEVFGRWARMGLDHYAELGIPAHLVAIKGRADAEREEFVDTLAAASMIFFSGGRPSFLAGVLRGTPVWTAIVAAIDRGAVFAGCSAGAMIANAERSSGRRRLDPWRSGLGVLPEIAVGVHWDGMPRFLYPVRDLFARTAPREAAFIGVDERTAILGSGADWQVFGSGSAHVRQGRDRRIYAAEQQFTLTTKR